MTAKEPQKVLKECFNWVISLLLLCQSSCMRPKSDDRYGKYAQTWPLNGPIWNKIYRPLAEFERACLIEMHLHEKSFGGNVKWPFKTGACLIHVEA